MKADHPGKRCRGWSRVVLVLLLVVLAVLGGGCFSKPQPAAQDGGGKIAKERRPLLGEKELGQVMVYYQTGDGNFLVPVTVTFIPTREVAKVAVEKLLAGPQGNGLKSVMPDGVKLRDVYILDNQQTIYVDVTKELLQVKDNQQAEKAIKALVLTLTSLDNARYVQLLVEGQSIAAIGEIKTDKPMERPQVVNSLLQNNEQQGVQVYFGDANALYFIPVTVPLPAGASQGDLPRAAVMALLAGPPEKSGLTRTIWRGTRLLALKIAEGVATVDLSREVTGYGGGSTAERALLGSLLFTLTQFPEVGRVQLLIEGQKREYLPEGSPIDKPLARPEKINFIQH